MRAVEATLAWRFFFGVLEGVGSMVIGCIVVVGGAVKDCGDDEPSESECAPFAAPLEDERRCSRGVLCSCRGERCWTGDTGDDGGDESCVGARANLVFFTVAGGVLASPRAALGDLSLLKDE